MTIDRVINSLIVAWMDCAPANVADPANAADGCDPTSPVEC